MDEAKTAGIEDTAEGRLEFFCGMTYHTVFRLLRSAAARGGRRQILWQAGSARCDQK